MKTYGLKVLSIPRKLYFITVNCILKSKEDKKGSKGSIKARIVDGRVIALEILNIQ